MISRAGDDQNFLAVGFCNLHCSPWKKAHPTQRPPANPRTHNNAGSFFYHKKRLNKLVDVNYNEKMENRFAAIRELSSKGKRSNPLVLKEFL
jgi:hypothetical protein